MEDIINIALKRSLAERGEKDGPLRYLEVGVHKGDTFKAVSSNIQGVEVIKEGVDPYGPFGELLRFSSQLMKLSGKKPMMLFFLMPCIFLLF